MRGDQPAAAAAGGVEIELTRMAALLMRMERDGLIVREPHPDDKRASRMSLSKKAKLALPQAKRRLQDVVEQATVGLSAAERTGMVKLLQRVVINLDRSKTEEPRSDA